MNARITGMPPARVQRQRSAGWKMPAGARYVGRPSLYANPWKIEQNRAGEWCVYWGLPDDHLHYTPPRESWKLHVPCAAREQAHTVAVELFRERFEHHPVIPRLAIEELAGLDLACWCPLDLACHVDVLLSYVNPEAAGRASKLKPILVRAEQVARGDFRTGGLQ